MWVVERRQVRILDVPKTYMSEPDVQISKKQGHLSTHVLSAHVDPLNLVPTLST